MGRVRAEGKTYNVFRICINETNNIIMEYGIRM